MCSNIETKTILSIFVTGRQHNHTEVVAEDARKQLPNNFESRQQQADWLAAQAKCQAEAEKKGLDYKRIRLLNVSAVEASNIEKKKSKRNPDIGFSDYEAMSARQYKRLVGQMEPMHVEKYSKLRNEVGEANFYSGINTMSQGTHKDKKESIDKLVESVEGQIIKRKSFSRRRTHNDEADIDYINEKNARFNKKLDRFYGEHTAEIKANLERGTAI